MTMKRLIPILMLLALLLTACDLRNRQSSEDYIPTGSGSPRVDWTQQESGLSGQGLRNVRKMHWKQGKP